MHRQQQNYMQPRKSGPVYQQHPHAAQQQAHLSQQAVQQQQQQHSQQQRQQQARQADAARRAKQPTDRTIPDELAEVVVGDGVQRYDQLRAVERRLDATMMRKRLDVNDNVNRRYTRRDGLLRVWIRNTAEGQPWQVTEEGMALGEDGFDFGDSSAATFRVKIEGRFEDDEAAHDGVDKGKSRNAQAAEDDGQASTAETKATPARRPRFSHFFKSITIDFDRNPALQPDGYNAIEWRKTSTGSNVDSANSEASFDTLEFERKGDENINITISLVRDEWPERCKLSPALAEILDSDEEDMLTVLHGIWEYARAMGLQEDEDKRNIRCDEPLRRLFHRDSIFFPEVPNHLRPHLQPLPPIKLNYTIRVDKGYIDGSDGSSPSEPTIYDLRVPLANPLTSHIARYQRTQRENPAHIAALRQITSLDTELALLAQKIHQTNAKRKFYENLAKDPVGFVKRWTSSQRRDLEVILAEERNAGLEGTGSGLMTEEWRRGGDEGVWGTGVARESVGLWLARMGKGY